MEASSNIKTLSVGVENSIALVKINRPEALNALNHNVIAELEAFFETLQKPSEIRGVILTGAGEKAFVAGADIKEIQNLKTASAFQFAARGQKIFRLIETSRVPVIAAVNGFALGGGLELALSCDFIFASDRAKLGLPETSLGLIPGFGGTVRLSRVVGLNQARLMILSGALLTAQEALDCGLVQKICPINDLISEAKKIIEQIILKGPKAVAVAKTTTLSAYDQAIDAALETEALAFSRLFETQEPLEGTSAFIEKRKPNWM